MNHVAPEPNNVCIHHMISKIVRVQPHSPAIDAWDGSLTYTQLESASNDLAYRLEASGIIPGCIVPVCLEKSMWTAVTALAVLKAGCAFVLLDTSLPTGRLRSIVEQTQSKFLLASSGTRLLAESLAKRVILADNVNGFRRPSNPTLEKDISPSNVLYVVFTSGTTGVPKGVMVPHKAFATAILYQAERLQFKPATRVFDYASYAFDVSINNILMTLATGGCLCVPSDTARKDGLTEAIVASRASLIHLTPSVSRLLDPKALPELKTLLLGGEALSREEAVRWSHLRLINTYGPAECTPTSTISDQGEELEQLVRIGKGAGTATWVADVDDDTRLAPLGIVGELVIEGPLVSSGYLGNSEASAASFIVDPPWLVQGAPGHAGRRGMVYKTGDLVRYNLNGSLSYVSRKDNQVKIRGQRVELSEIEYHISTCYTEALQVAVDVVTLAGQETGHQLAAFIVPESSANQSGSASLLDMPESFTEVLEDRLPGYMVPSVYIRLNSLPLSSSAKTDRTKLKAIAGSIPFTDLVRFRSAPRDAQSGPLSEPERLLQSIWAKVLNMDTKAISVIDSFFKLGGDSITAMQVSSSARASGLNISTAQVLRHKTIRRILEGITITSGHATARATTHQVEITPNQPFPLGPIMQLYFQLQKDPLVPLDQNVLLKLNNRMSHAAIVEALEAIVSRHAMLRARFQVGSTGQWESVITENVSEGIFFRYMRDVHPESMPQLIKDCRKRLDIQHGPLIAALVIEDRSTQQIFLSCHHLVVDLVSWGAILGDLELLLTSSDNSLPPLPSLSFPVWSTLQAEHIAETKTTKADFTLPELMISRPKPYWGLETDFYLHEYSQDMIFTLTKETSSAILGTQCNHPFNTRPVELLISALLYSFGRVFTDRELPTIFNEGHGREVWDESLDITSTVGWFTTMLPIDISSESPLDLLDLIRKTKDHIQSYPGNGWESFVSNFSTATSATEFASLFPVEILFNYAGAKRKSNEDGALFETMPVPINSQPDAMKRYRRTALIEVLVETVNNCISVTFVTDSRLCAARSGQLSRWFEQYEKTLIQMESTLKEKTFEFTLVDFPSAFSAYEDIQAFQQELLPKVGIDVSDIEDIFPCSPMQEGILMSQAKHAAAYQTQLKMKISTSTKPIDIDHLQEAWRMVVRRHALLRAILIDSFPGTKKTMHIILKNPTPIIYLRAHQDAAVIAPTLNPDGLQHQLTISRTNDNKADLFLVINHVILDAHSRRILVRDLEVAYSSKLPVNPSSFHRFTDYVEQQSLDDGLHYWASYLYQVEPCQFPTLKYTHTVSNKPITVPGLDTKALRTFCESLETTPAVVIQVAWALVLKHYTGSCVPCFGVISSGRDLPIEDVEEVFGPLIGMLACRVLLKDDTTVADVLDSTQEDMLKGMGHQTVPIASIHNKLGLGTSALFNSVISLQKMQEEPESGDQEVNIRIVDGDDNTDYDVCIQVTDRPSVIEITITSPTDIVGSCGPQVANLLGMAISIIVQSKPESKLVNLDLLDDKHTRQISNWNSQVPQAIRQCLHTSFYEQVSLGPNRQAVDAWDGEFTYQELHVLSTQLALYLISTGVVPNSKIPIWFEKSRWAIVAMIAIMKTGSAFIPLDPTQAPDRRLGIIQQLDAKTVLTSENMATAAEVLSPEYQVISIGPNSSHMSYKPSDSQHLPGPDPESLAYILFTSGSTGLPKGVLIQHLAIASSCFYHGKVMGFDESTRTLQFSSFTFDPSILEIFTTLRFGGCVCMLSDDDRLGSNDDALRRLRVTLMAITTSVARLIQPSQVPNLTTLLISGEVSKPEDFKRWSHLPRLLHGYGPTEASVLCVIGGIDFSLGNFKSIGTGVGSNTWVVDANDFHRLLPIGSIGELLIQGPILARGYLNDQEKTETVFVESPRWASQLGLPNESRFYKTGDLVRYGDNGSLIYVGRKDNQVKIRGQRVEPSEIEHHVLACIPNAQHVAVEIINPSGVTGRSELAAFIVSGDKQTTVGMGIQSKPRVFLLPNSVEKELMSRLPEYMVPTVILLMESLPLGTTGKIDRHILRNLGSTVTDSQLSALRSTTHGSKRAPSTELEELLQRIWARILRIDTAQIGIDDSFFRLGGDSMRAMEVSSVARAAGLDISTRHILQGKTISNIVGVISDTQPSRSVIPDIKLSPGDLFPLSPMQQFYLNYQPHPGMAFDQTVFLKVHSELPHKLLGVALEKLVNLHPALQARFRRGPSHEWEQYLADGEGNAFILKCFEPVEMSDYSRMIAETRDCLNIEKGPLLAAALFKTSGTIELFISIHHLAVDIVSWKTLISDVEIILKGSIPEPPPVSFPRWSTLQAGYMASHLALDEIQLATPMISYWGSDVETCKIPITKSFLLSRKSTQALLGPCNDAFQTSRLELLLAALFYSFHMTFPDRPIPSIWNEGHGREPWDDQLDISRTVGWFTTLYPVQMTRNNQETLDIWDIIRMTKDWMRGLSRSGWTFFTSQFVSSEASKRFYSSFPVEVLLNYASEVGKQYSEKQDTTFSTLSLPHGCEPQTAQDFREFALFNVFMQERDGRMVCNFSYDTNLQHQDQILQWLSRYEHTLEDLAIQLPVRQAEWTLADFPSVFKTYKEISDFSSHVLPELGGIALESIEEIFPCSPMQEGILMTQARDPDMYRTTTVFRLSTAATGAPVEIKRIKNSWRAVMRQHVLLRAAFVRNFPGAGGTMHVVFKDPDPIITVRDWQEHPNTGDEEASGLLEHDMTIMPQSATEAIIVLKMNHAITDAFSRDILLNDFTKAYLGEKLNTKQVSFSRFISHINQQSSEDALSYWTAYLTNVEPCHVAEDSAVETAKERMILQVNGVDSSAIRAICSDFEITPAVVCHIAWALVLCQFTGSACPCFGVVSSGRDIPVPEADTIFGPFISMVPVRVFLDSEATVVETLRTAHGDYIAGTSYQGVSLAAIHNALGLGQNALFNTVISFRRVDDKEVRNNRSQMISVIDGRDPSEV